MKRLRYYLAAIALVASLGGLSLQGMGSTSSQHAGSVAGQLAWSDWSKPDGPCPVLGYDC